MIEESLFKVANTPKTYFLVQAEIKAINEGLEYKEIIEEGTSFRGYFSSDGRKQGPGIEIYNDPYTYGAAEYHLDK